MAYRWESLKAMPSKKVFSSPLIHEDHLYVIGGCDERGIPLDCFEMFNAKQKKWHRLMNLPTKRAGPAVAAIGNLIVAAGGVSEQQKPLDVVEIYDISEKCWTKGELLQKKLQGMSCIVRENKIYLIGGMLEDTTPTNMFVELKPETGICSELPSMITPRYATFPFLIDDKLYVIGGRRMKEPSTAFEVFDFSTQQWSALPSIPSARVFAMYTASKTHIFSIGGLLQPTNKGFSDVCEVFDIQKGEWKNGEVMPTKRGDFAIGMINDKVVCAGGLSNDGKPLKCVEIYDQSTNYWMTLGGMPTTHCSCTYIVHNDRLFVCGGLSCRGPSNCADVLEFT